MDLQTNVIYCGDCLDKLKELPDESIDLIYIDPPFSSNRNYVAFWQEQEKRHFEDRFENVRAYIDYMTPRLVELYRVLKTTGSFYYHCDWHASHYIKIRLDDLFGYHNFRNEIVWCYRRYTAVSSKYQRLHDTILFYSKSKNATFNAIYADYGEKSGVKDSHYKQDEDGRWYRWQKRKDREPYKIYLSEGVRLGDVWDIPIINASSKERLGYPTQKPLDLLDRIMKVSSNENEIVLDAFCGCGTTLISAQVNNRKWIGIDISPTSCRVVAVRLEKDCGLKEGINFYVKDMPKTAEELRQYPAFEFQNWAINAIGGIPSRSKVRDGGIDGKLYPIEDIKKEKKGGIDLFGEIDRYIPIQVKRTDQVGRPEIDKFLTAIKRDGRNKGIFVGFSFSRDVEKEVRRIERDEGIIIDLITVDEITKKELNGRMK